MPAKAPFPILITTKLGVWLIGLDQLGLFESVNTACTWLQIPDTYSVDGARKSYFGQLFPLNPGGIVPAGPTATDLGLGQDPKRGSYNMEDLFYWSTTAAADMTV